MKTLAARFKAVKTRVGGNREKTTFEHTFGQPSEEEHYITTPSPWQRRILAQLEFALTLSEENQGMFDGEITQALNVLEAGLTQSGALTNQHAQQAEQALAPLAAAAKEYSLILCAHAHIDMNWMWSWQETVSATLETFRTMLTLMREYPQFTFSQSQAAVYQIVEKYEPSMMAEIRQRIEEGRWEITASAWVETDKNMPSTESLVRHILYTKKYLQEKWGVDPASLEIDFSPDTFGHSAHLPALNQHGGVKYYYHCRGNADEAPMYLWQAPSGEQVLVYREPYWYNSAITPHIGAGLIGLSRQTGGLKTGLVVYGVGDHGGGPTRRDIELATQMQQWPIYPAIRFGTLREYFQLAETVKDRLPVIDHELNYIFTGCYTTQSRIKLGNRQSEGALYRAEALSALANALAGQDYAAPAFEDAWQNVLFTHFHDILTGSCVPDTREHAMALFSHALAIANTQQATAMRALTQMIDTSALDKGEDISTSQSEGAGVGYGWGQRGMILPERGSGKRRIFHVFNPGAHQRQSVVELTVWDWTGDLRQLSVQDEHGNPLDFQLLDEKMQKYWDHKYMRVLVLVTLPPMGYTTVVLDEAELQRYPFYYNPSDRVHLPNTNPVLENAHLRAEFCYSTGELLSLISKVDGKELIPHGKRGGLSIAQADGHSDNAWMIGRYMSVNPLIQNVVLKPLSKGALRQGFEMEVSLPGCNAKATLTLDANSPALCVDLTVDWTLFSKDQGPVPTLIYTVPVAYEASQYLYDAVAGAITREGMHLDVPALTYGAAINPDGQSLAIATDCKYGFRGVNNRIGVTLIHPSNHPDPYPEYGVHHIKLYLLAQKACPKAMQQAAFDAIHAPGYISARAHKGSLPATGALLGLNEDSTAVISAIKHAEDGTGMIIRLYETCGKPTTARLTLPKAITAACLVDGSEQPLGGAVQTSENTVTISLGAHKLCAVKLNF